MANLVFRYTILEIVLRCRFIPRVRMKTPYNFTHWNLTSILGRPALPLAPPPSVVGVRDPLPRSPYPYPLFSFLFPLRNDYVIYYYIKPE